MTHLSLDQLEHALENRVSNLVLVENIDSTHLMARRLIDQVDSEGTPLFSTLIVALRQDQGQGRNGRSWISPEGGLYFNWVHGDVDPSVTQLLPLLAASSAHQAITNIGVENLSIKWPNDLLVEGKKIGGLLVHARHGDQIMATVGLGVNLGPTPVLDEKDPTEAISLTDLLGPGDLTEWAVSLIGGFLDVFDRALVDPQAAVDHWRKHLVHRSGDQMSVRLSSGEKVSGIFAGVSPEGYVRITTDQGESILTGGDVVEK
ncbi:MAG: biotin--[acetyl-CoA-carboxylase] ligase [Thermoanaerobaculales bacterium]|nr:biotin--[acetyl-CoA-carboxylase] ligase [Thermoanaerobaculales bacterium]